MGYALENVNGFWFETCANCSIEFALPKEMEERRRRDHKNFYCPNGHELHYGGQSQQEKRISDLERQLANEKSNLEREQRTRKWAESRAKGANIAAGIAKKKLQRTIERVHAGVCPHCHRTFKQLAAHMQAKHPQAD